VRVAKAAKVAKVAKAARFGPARRLLKVS